MQLHEKQPYVPTAAFAKARQHAYDFLTNRFRQAENLGGLIERPPPIVSPYDAELFGHWWYEGTEFVEWIFRHAQNGGHEVLPVSGYEYLLPNPCLLYTSRCV